MSLRISKTKAEIIEIAQIALQNVESNPNIQPLMEALGYNTTKINEGKALLSNTKTLFAKSQTLEDLKAKAYKEFEDLKLKTEAIYSKDRKIARIIFKTETLAYKELVLKGAIPKAYLKWTSNVSTFYNVLNTTTAILVQLESLQVTKPHVEEVLTNLAMLENLKAAYIQTKGNAQNATKAKYKAFKELEKWMGIFFRVAEIALENNPQLLESLGKIVRG